MKSVILWCTDSMERSPVVGWDQRRGHVFVSDAFLGFYCFNIQGFPYTLSLGACYRDSVGGCRGVIEAQLGSV